MLSCTQRLRNMLTYGILKKNHFFKLILYNKHHHSDHVSLSKGNTATAKCCNLYSPHTLPKQHIIQLTGVWSDLG